MFAPGYKMFAIIYSFVSKLKFSPLWGKSSGAKARELMSSQEIFGFLRKQQ